jgi:undecaprenyl diphosphate synthase
VAFNYGGRDEIVQAVRRIVREGIPAEAITEETIAERLYTAGIPDPDLVIRTSGEVRTSNFLLWQSAYAEWYFTPVFWPDFGRENLLEAIADYNRRERRFGRVLDPDEG